MRLPGGFLILALLLVSGAASAERVRLDDSLSPVDSLHIDLAWDTDATAALALALPASAEDLPPASGRLPGVEVRLDTREFVGRQARIFLSIQGLGESADARLGWEAGGRFLAGSVRPGQATLVFEGLVEQPVTSGVFSFVLEVGEVSAVPQNSLEIIYEIETLP
jgi:hypothetical protein